MFNRFNDFVYSSLKNIVDIKKNYNVNISGDTRIIDTIYMIDFNSTVKYLAVINYIDCELGASDIHDIIDFLNLDAVILFKDVDDVRVYSSDSPSYIKVYRDCYFAVELYFFEISGNDLSRLFPNEADDHKENSLKTSGSFSKEDDYRLVYGRCSKGLIDFHHIASKDLKVVNCNSFTDGEDIKLELDLIDSNNSKFKFILVQEDA